MNQLNSIILEGNVVKQGESSEPAKGFKVCKFPLAVNRITKSPAGESCEEVSFFDVESYGKMAEICEKFSTKGRGVRVVGRLKQNRWKDKDGKNQSKVFVIAEHLEFKPNFQKTENDEKKADGVATEKSNENSKENSAPQVAEAVVEETVF
ncbi:MAG: single-stranded DNA-binding protein [Treponema sp.]|nr:single-stranded DNA-binding protein [Treponema sp.]